MYDIVSTNIHTPVGMTKSFPIKVGLHQGTALSPLFLRSLWNKSQNPSGKLYHGSCFSPTI